jgi:uncharacterized protein YrzB (UPF0473 family)
MAIQYARLRYISRSKGMNACSRAAYNGNLKIKDNKIGKTFDFSKRNTNVYHETLLPIHADKEFQDVEYLMNEVEANERQKNSQLLKEYVLALPEEKEISLRHKIALTKLFVRKLRLLKEGLAVVIDIHQPAEDDINWYSKILVTTRRFLYHGKSLGKKARDLDIPVKGGRNKVFVPKNLSINNGEIWRDIQNSFFEFLGLDLKVNHINDIPQSHIGTRKYGILAEEKRLLKVSN